MAQQTKALFTCTEAGYEMALAILERYRKGGMQVFFYGAAKEEELIAIGEANGMSHVLHFLDAKNLKLVSLTDEMGGFTADITVDDLILPPEK